MSYTVVIVESPAKCKKIEGYLGPNYKCIASFGHIQELNGIKSIEIDNNFKPNFNLLESKIQQINKIKTLLKNSKEVLIASDDDREGEAIGWHICQVFKLPLTTKRIIFHEITKPALERAVSNPTTLNMNIIHAQQARQVLDLLVGYKISPILWKNISRNSKDGLSAGRCQTPALRLVYDNQKDIDDSFEIIQHDKVGQTLKSSSYNFKTIFCSLARISYLSDIMWHSTSEVFTQYEKFYLFKDLKKLSYRRVFDILGEIEQSGLIMSKNLSAGRYGYSKQYMLSIPVETVRILSESIWKNWESIKNARFEMKYNPRHRGNSYSDKLVRYDDVKNWHKLLGLE